MFDLGPTAQEMSRLLAGVRDAQLTEPTPCQRWTVADLLAHVNQFATVFTHNARKEDAPRTDGLPDDWRVAIPAQVDELAQAWSEESAWSGSTSAGGIEMDAADNALVALEELVIHGWDLSRATGQDFIVEDGWLDGMDRFFTMFGERIDSGQGPYGPAVPAPENASRLERTVAHTGRDPRWSAG